MQRVEKHRRLPEGNQQTFGSRRPHQTQSKKPRHHEGHDAEEERGKGDARWRLADVKLDERMVFANEEHVTVRIDGAYRGENDERAGAEKGEVSRDPFGRGCLGNQPSAPNPADSSIASQ